MASADAGLSIPSEIAFGKLWCACRGSFGSLTEPQSVPDESFSTDGSRTNDPGIVPERGCDELQVGARRENPGHRKTWPRATPSTSSDASPNRANAICVPVRRHSGSDGDRGLYDHKLPEGNFRGVGIPLRHATLLLVVNVGGE